MLCLIGFELYSRWVPLTNARNSKVFKYGRKKRQGTENKMNCTP